MQIRAFVLAAIFVFCTGLLHVNVRTAPVPVRQPLLGLPLSIGDWQGRSAPPLEARVLAVLGADDYTNRIYTHTTGRQAALFIGYHASQRQGDSIHSPMNCLPGAGWLPVGSARMTLTDRRDPSRPSDATVNQVIVQKGENRQLVLYWYQSHGRIIASEYAAKAFLFLDAIHTARTDSALVRIVTPLGDGGDTEMSARAAALGFAERVLPLLTPYLPS